MAGSSPHTTHRHPPGQLLLLLVFGEINFVASLVILLARDQLAPAGIPVALLALACLWGLWGIVGGALVAGYSDRLEAIRLESPSMAQTTLGSRLLIALLALLGASLCYADDVKIHQSGDVDISSLRTYHVVSKSLEETEGPLAEIMFPALHVETDALLGRLGFEATDEPDFLIAFQGTIIDHLDISGGYQQHVGDNFVVESWSPAYRKSTSDEIFAVMMMVPGHKEPFWVGTEIIGLGYHLDPEAATNRSAKALKKILKHFPPQ